MFSFLSVKYVFSYPYFIEKYNQASNTVHWKVYIIFAVETVKHIYFFIIITFFTHFQISLKIKDFLWTGVFCLIDQLETNTAFAFKFSEPCLNTWYWKVFNLSITSSIIIQLKLKLLKYWLLLVNKPILRAQSFDFKTHKFFGLYELFIDSSTY